MTMCEVKSFIRPAASSPPVSKRDGKRRASIELIIHLGRPEVSKSSGSIGSSTDLPYPGTTMKSNDTRIVDPLHTGNSILARCQRKSRKPVRRNQKPRSCSSDARPRDNHPFLFMTRHAGRTALCPEMSVAPAAVHNPSLSLAGGTTIRWI
jgi:hypothetical protein